MDTHYVLSIDIRMNLPSLPIQHEYLTKITWYHPISCILIAFYILNLYWYMKIINILVTGGGNSHSSHQKSDTKKEQ